MRYQLHAKLYIYHTLATQKVAINRAELINFLNY